MFSGSVCHLQADVFLQINSPGRGFCCWHVVMQSCRAVKLDDRPQSHVLWHSAHRISQSAVNRLHTQPDVVCAMPKKKKR